MLLTFVFSAFTLGVLVEALRAVEEALVVATLALGVATLGFETAFPVGFKMASRAVLLVPKDDMVKDMHC